MQCPLAKASDEIVSRELKTASFQVGDFVALQNFQPFLGQLFGVGDRDASMENDV